MKNFNIKNENGRSMIEMLGVLAIIGVLSVGGIAGYSKAMMKYRINKTIEQITLIAGNIRTFFATQSDYKYVYCDSEKSGTCNSNNGCYAGSAPRGCTIIKKAKILPDEMITVNDQGKITSITNPFGYGIRLAYASKYIDTDYKAFSIIYFIGENEEACIELLTNDWTVAGVNFIALEGMDGDDYGFFTFPVSVDNAVKGCSTVTSNTKVSFEFDVGVDLQKPYFADDCCLF